MKTLFLSLWLLPVTLFAQQSSTTKTATATIEPMSSSYLLKLTGGLILVVALIFVLAWLVKKMNLTPQSQTGLIRVVSTLNIGARERIVLVEVGGEQILIGFCPGRMEKLHTLATPLETDSSGAGLNKVDAIKAGTSSANQSKFSQLLAAVAKK